MFYISIQDSLEPDKWCFVSKWHTWDKAAQELRELMTSHNKPCRVEDSENPPEYSHVPSVY